MMILHLSKGGFFPFYFGGFIHAKTGVFLYPRKMKTLVPQDGVTGTEGESWSSFYPLWVRGQVVYSLSGIAILSIMPSCLYVPHKTTSTKKWTILPEGSKDGPQLEMEKHISLHVQFLFQLPVKIHQSLEMCFSPYLD